MENTSEEMIRHYHFSDGTVLTVVGKAKIDGDDARVEFGWAVCDRRDQWNRKKGIMIARNRLSKRPIVSNTTSLISFKKACLLAFIDPTSRTGIDPVHVAEGIFDRSAREIHGYLDGTGRL